jgi:CheY-like chemotaxis protein
MHLHPSPKGRYQSGFVGIGCSKDLMNSAKTITGPAADSGPYLDQAEKCLRVLYVDDNDFVCDGFCSVFSVKGWSCESASSGNDALIKLTSWPESIDFLITDHQMAGMNGLDLVRRVRATDFKGKILVYSTTLRAEEQAAYQELKVDAIIPKTGNVNRTFEAIEKLQQPPMP